jgi:hypothetical protein
MLRSVAKLSLAIFDDSRGTMRVISLCVVMTGVNLLAWTWVFVVFHSRLLCFGRRSSLTASDYDSRSPTGAS